MLLAESKPRPGSKSAFGQGAMAMMLLFTAGSSFSLGVFIPAVEAASYPRNALVGVWESAMGAMHFFSAPILIAAGMYLDADKNQVLGFPLPTWALPKTTRVRILSLISLVSFACFAITAQGAANSTPWILFTGVSIQAFPLAIVYILGIEVLLAWFPRHTGLAVGVGQTAFGLGTVFFTQFFSLLIAKVHHVTAIYVTSCTLTAGAILPTVFMCWPSHEEVLHLEEKPLLDSEQIQVSKIPWPRLLCLPNFWFYLIAVFTTSASYMLNPYFFKLGMLFNGSFDQLILWFNLSTLVGILCGLVFATLTDVMKTESGFCFSGAKNQMIIFMLMQTILMFIMLSVNHSGSLWAFLVIKSLLKIIVNCHVGCAAILARDLFGSNNSCIVFGFGAGLALGGGEGVSAWLMASVEAAAGIVRQPSDYNPFYWIATVWSLVGLISVVMVRRHNDADDYDPILL